MNRRLLAMAAKPILPSPLIAELLATLRDESDALKADDAARLAAAESRKRHLLRQLAPFNSAPAQRRD